MNKIIWFWRLTLHQFFKVNDLFKTCYLDKTYYSVENFQATGFRISLTLILKRRLQIRFSNPLRICVTDSWRKSYLYTDSWSDSLVNVRTPAYSLRSYKGRSGLIDGQHNGMGVLLQKLTYLCFTNFQKRSELVYSVVHLLYQQQHKAIVFLFVVKEWRTKEERISEYDSDK